MGRLPGHVVGADRAPAAGHIGVGASSALGAGGALLFRPPFGERGPTGATGGDRGRRGSLELTNRGKPWFQLKQEEADQSPFGFGFGLTL